MLNDALVMFAERRKNPMRLVLLQFHPGTVLKRCLAAKEARAGLDQAFGGRAGGFTARHVRYGWRKDISKVCLFLTSVTG